MRTRRADWLPLFVMVLGAVMLAGGWATHQGIVAGVGVVIIVAAVAALLTSP